MSRSRSIASSVERSVIAPNSASQRSPKASRSSRPAAVRSGQRSSCACSPIAVANVGLRRKNSARNASTRPGKSCIGGFYGRARRSGGARIRHLAPDPPRYHSIAPHDIRPRHSRTEHRPMSDPIITRLEVHQFASELPDIGRDYNGFNLVYEPGAQDADPGLRPPDPDRRRGRRRTRRRHRAGLRGVPDVRPVPVRQERARTRAHLHGRQPRAPADGADRVRAGRHRPVGPRRQVLRHAGPSAPRRVQGPPAGVREHLPRRPPAGRPVEPGGVSRTSPSSASSWAIRRSRSTAGVARRSARRSPTSTRSASGSAGRWT